MWSVVECVVSWTAGVAAWPLSWVVSPLDRPCDEDEPTPAPGSELCTVAGEVLCVVGVLCTSDAEPVGAPGAVVCVVGVPYGVGEGCTLGAEPSAVAGAVPCGLGVEMCDGWDVVPVDWVFCPEPPDAGELPISACGAAG